MASSSLHGDAEASDYVHAPTTTTPLALAPTTLVNELKDILDDTHRYKVLLKYRGPDAQKLLDIFQCLLDSELDQNLRRKLIVAIQRLSHTSGLYPMCYELKGIDQATEHPVMAGGFADIYKATFQGQVVCIKAIRIYQDSQLDRLSKKISKEALLWGQLRHINLLPFYGMYHFKNQACLVAPWLEHGNINTYLKKNPESPRCLLADDVARGIAYLHDNGIIHGDLKGPNVLVDDVGRARVADFGISSISDPDIIAWTSQSAAASKGGSHRWQAPELFDMENGEVMRNSTKSDVYAWGCVCYEIFKGEVPFYNMHHLAVVHHVKLGGRPGRPSKSSRSWLEWGLTQGLWSLMKECWNADPDARPSISQVTGRLSDELGAAVLKEGGRGRHKRVASPTKMHRIHRSQIQRMTQRVYSRR